MQLALVCAGAGFGKTSFLATSAAADPRPCAWVTAGEEHADLRLFAAHLEAAVLGAAAPSPAGGTDDLAGAALTRMILHLRNRPGGATLVVDDLHLAAGDAVIAFLERFVRFLPQRCTLILASREPVGIAAMKLQSGGRVVRVGAAQLAFDEEEIGSLFRRHFPDLELPPPLRARIQRRTEGWPAGVEIFFQGLAGGGTEEIEETLEAASGARAGWFSFFAEEVLRRLDPAERSFLLSTSVLPRLDAALCDRLIGSPGSRRILDRMCERNRFTFRTAEGNDSFRYHGLFRAFLRDRLEREVGDRATRRLLRRAGTLLAGQAAWGDAVDAFAEAGDGAAVLRIVERRAGALIGAGRSDAIRRVLERVPRRDLVRRPAAMLALGRASDHSGDWAEAETCFRRGLRAGPDSGTRIELLAGLAQLRLRRGDPRGSLVLGREALSAAAAPPILLREQILATLGVAACELGRLDEGERYLRNARALIGRSQDRDRHLRAFYLLPANLHYRRGEFRPARDATRSALVEFRRLGDRRRTCHCLGVLGYLGAESADVREARELTADSMRLAESLDYPLMLGYGRLALARCAWLDGDAGDARRQAEAAREIGRRLGETGLLTISLGRLAEAALLDGRRAAARRGARLAFETARSLGDVYEEARACTLLGQLHSGRPEARTWWTRGERIVRRIGMRFELHRLLLLRIDAGDAAERRLGPLLAELLSGVEALGHEFLFLRLHRAAGARVLARAVGCGREVDTAARLLVELGEDAVGPVAALLDEAPDSVRARAVEILRAVGGAAARAALARAARARTPSAVAAAEAARELLRTADPPLRIHTLGSFEIEIGGRRLASGDWTSRRARRLFLVLLLHRFRWVPREALIETLWPDGDPERGQNNLRQSLHLLRRELEPGLRVPRESMYVRSRHDACRLAPGEDRFHDVEAFDEAVRRGEAQRGAGSHAGAETAWRRALELYGGAFLSEFPYEEFAAEERERLREALLRTLDRFMEGCAAGGRWDEVVPLARRGLAEDRWHEEFHFRLVEALWLLGHRAEAVTAWHGYEETMIRELMVLPSARMKALAATVAASTA